MKYESTSGQYTTDLQGAALRCFAPDSTLYLPERIPVIPRAFFNNIGEMTLKEIAYVVVTSLLGDDVDPTILKRIVDDTFTYSLPIRNLRPGTDVLELFEGPTMAFKDISAQFVANFVKQSLSLSKPAVAIVATTGNTGAAVANAFGRLRGVNVAVLYPRGILTRSQLAQITTVNDNVHAIEVGGDISRCKQMVRDAMNDASFNDSIQFVCVNTANYLRIVPQVVLFFYAYSRLVGLYGSGDGFTPAIPCGNLSTLTSAIIAKRLGLPMGKIIAACNANDDFVRVTSGELLPENVNININSRTTLAKAMDSGYPTNLGRILKLYHGNISLLSDDICAVSVSDAEISETIKNVAVNNNYVVDPHTAVAIGALNKLACGHGTRNVVLATAHPAKSLDIMTEITGRAIELPLQLTRFMTRGTPPIKMPPTYPALRKFLNGLTNPV